MPYQLDIVDVEPTQLAAVRKRTTFEALGSTILESLNEVYAFLETASVQRRGQNVVVYLDDVPTVEIGVEVFTEFQSTDSILFSSTPGGLAARTVHIGPYTALPKAHAAIRTWCRENTKVLAGPSWEVYGDWDNDPQKLRTDVHYLLKDSE